MSFSLPNVRARFGATAGTDPIFAPVDGANCPDAVPAQHTSGAPYGGRKGKGKKALKDAYSLLLARGVIRVAMPWPPTGNPEPEFTLELLADAPKCNGSPDFGLGTGVVSVYRRPQISAQLDFKTVRPNGSGPVLPGSVMWDGREPSLEQQAIDATRGHAQASRDPTPDEIKEIVDFETGVYSAQLVDRRAGRLDRAGATGGPVHLAGRPIDPVFHTPPRPFDEYDAWSAQGGGRLGIARGQKIFEERTLQLGNVLPPQLGNPFRGTCATCHNLGHAGASVIRPPLRDLGIGGTAQAFGGRPPATDLPVFRLTCHADAPPHPFLGLGPVEMGYSGFRPPHHSRSGRLKAQGCDGPSGVGGDS